MEILTAEIHFDGSAVLRRTPVKDRPEIRRNAPQGEINPLGRKIIQRQRLGHRLGAV